MNKCKELGATVLAGLIVGFMILSTPIEALKAFGILPRDRIDRDDNWK